MKKLQKPTKVIVNDSIVESYCESQYSNCATLQCGCYSDQYPPVGGNDSAQNESEILF